MRALFLSLGLFFLHACATVDLSGTQHTATLSEDDLSEFETGEFAIIGMNVHESMKCPHFRVALADENGKRQAGMKTATPRAGEVQEPTFVRIPPGRYTFEKVVCGAFVIPNADRWFAPIEVKAGDVRYLGTFKPTFITVESAFKSTALQNIISLGALALVNKETRQYPVYEFEGSDTIAQDYIASTYPVLTDRLEIRKPDQLLSKEAFSIAFSEAFAPNADGTLPSFSTARVKLTQLIQLAYIKSLTEYLERNGKNKVPIDDTI